MSNSKTGIICINCGKDIRVGTPVTVVLDAVATFPKNADVPYKGDRLKSLTHASCSPSRAESLASA